MRGLYGSSPDTVWKALTAAQHSLVTESMTAIDVCFLISSTHLGGEKKSYVIIFSGISVSTSRPSCLACYAKLFAIILLLLIVFIFFILNKTFYFISFSSALNF